MRVLETVRRVTARIVSVVTAVLLAVGLFLAYWVGVALTRLVAEGFSRSMLSRRRRLQDSYWRDAEGYGTGLADCADQS